MDNETIFHKIAQKKLPAHIIWEDHQYMAFLTIFPNTLGATVVIPKMWAPSDFAEADDNTLQGLVTASKIVSNILKEKFDDVGRVGLVFEGFGVNYLHAKLYPLHGTAMEGWKVMEDQKKRDYFHTYPGYICSNDSDQADDEELQKLAAYLRGETKTYE